MKIIQGKLIILRNIFFYIVGIVFLALAKTKNIIKGYSSPKPFDISEYERCAEYDTNVVEHWLSHLHKYTKMNINDFIKEKNVLELGPGSDLGIGLCLIAKGCSQYNACDVNNLIESTPDSFYEYFFKKLENMDNKIDINFLQNQLTEAQKGNASRLNYIVSEDFDLISTFGEETIDVVFSQAAFEHFDNINATISQLSSVCKTGAILVTEIDLMTHSRWIRDKDPNNIYRYPNFVYNAFWFKGIPNRVRPFQYKDALERCGWTDISITPLTKLNEHNNNYSGINKNFSHYNNQMEYLSIMLCARKGDDAQN
jgi:SAM-dependent methyltransferase